MTRKVDRLKARSGLSKAHSGLFKARSGLSKARSGLSIAAVLFALAWTSAASADPSDLPSQFAYNYGETETPRLLGMSGALRAFGGGTAAPYINPANLGITRVYHIGAFVQATPEAARHLYGGTIIDSTRRFSGGVSVIGGFLDADGIDRSQIDVRLPLAFAITDRFHLGLAGRYLFLDQEGLGALGDSRVSGGLKDPDDAPRGRSALVNTITFDAGLTIVATEGLNIAVTGYNLSYPNNSLLPTMVGGGIGYGSEDFTIEVDAIGDFNSYEKPNPRVMAGAEYLIADSFPIRAGYRFDMMNGSGQSPTHQVSVGFGYLDPRFGIEAGLRRTLVKQSHPMAATMISAGVSFHLESLGVPIQEF